jgi:hypothetical protein
MVIVRLLSLLLLVVALMLLGADVVTTFELEGSFVTRSLDAVIQLFSGFGMNAWLEATVPPSVAGILVVFFNLPGWLPTGILGVLFALVSGKSED